MKLIQKPDKSQEEIDQVSAFLKKIPNFSYVFKKLNYKTQQIISQSVECQNAQESAILFRKGDPSDFLYIIIHGEVLIFDEIQNEKGKFEIPINQLSSFHVFGCKGFTRPNQARTLSAKITKNCFFIKIPGQVYTQYVQEGLIEMKDKIICHLEKFIPGMHKLGAGVKEKMSFIFFLKTAFKNEKLIRQDFESEYLYFIAQGECAIVNEVFFFHNQREVQKYFILGEGSFFGEDSVFFGKQQPYTVKVNSENALLMCIKRSDVPKVPDKIYQELYKQAAMQSKYRNTLIQNSSTKFQQMFEISKQSQLKPIVRGSQILSPKILSPSAKHTIEILINEADKTSWKQKLKRLHQANKLLIKAREETAKHLKLPSLHKVRRYSPVCHLRPEPFCLTSRIEESLFSSFFHSQHEQ